MYDTPILFIIFNRPNQTQQVFDEIKKQKPKQFFIAADGPRNNHEQDIKLCKATRAIIDQIDWECEIKTLFSEVNLGCGLAPATAITWFFEHVEEGIILEDDCVPNISFFTFCADLLARYKKNENIKMISGTSFQPTSLEKDTYYFSKYPHVWGWATWRRAWTEYNFDLKQECEQERETVIGKTFKNKREQKMWRNNMNMIISGLDAWDYQFMYWMWKNEGICITPWRNLISNIGFGSQATHTHNTNSSQSAMEQFEIGEIKHPKVIGINKKADQYERYTILLEPQYQHFYNRTKSIFKRIKGILFLKNE
ncbi:hypothetical protein ABIB40_003600 [Pedobacter sp. UYP30]|uniref:nucleotide-diphospho-sugar transferase n=1 Tax=Pedobacter sp. UYP30 TaxID=1756400 RepID=UPI0033921E5D